MIEISRRRLPVGAELARSGGVDFRVWAPGHRSVEVVIASEPPGITPMHPEPGGYFSVHVPAAGAGSLYKYRLNGECCYPDPASRFQPHGPHEYSEVVDPTAYRWNDGSWKGVRIEGQVLYEMHIGTFTEAGTWNSAVPELKNLAELGVTVLEVMPVNEFPGRFGWGYDGVHPYAPTHLYGVPDDFRTFVDTAHSLGMGVILDVVYNHLGPDGNYLPAFSTHYFTARHETDWGEAINFYDAESGPVREFFIANAGYWIDEFHLDGLRLDATQNIYDESEDHVIAALTREARRKAGNRAVIVVGENEPQDTRLVRSPEKKGYGLDALWNDDFHHSAMVRMTGHNEAYYTDYLGSPQEFISASKYGYLYQGQWYSWQGKRRGKPSYGCPPPAFINFLQNHDQLANSARGERLHSLSAPGVFRTMTALLLLAPGTPMLFQGQEFAASSPFLFFADHEDPLAEKVREGRRNFLSQFRSLAQPSVARLFADPGSVDTFERSKLDQSERVKNSHIVKLHRDLLAIRRQHRAFSRQQTHGVDGAVLSTDAFVLRFFDEDEWHEDRLLVVNFGRDLHLSPAPEPLLAPPEDMEWDVLWSSEDPAYGGSGRTQLDTADNWHIPGQAAVVLKPAPLKRTLPSLA